MSPHVIKIDGPASIIIMHGYAFLTRKTAEGGH
jgi:hypothetical protein